MTITIREQFKSIPNLDREVLLNRYISYLNLVRSGFTPNQAKMQVFKSNQDQFQKARRSYLEM